MPKEPDLPEDSPAFHAAIRRVGRIWAWSGLLLALAGVAALATTAFQSVPGYWLFGLGLALEFVAIVKRSRFRRAYIARHPL